MPLCEYRYPLWLKVLYNIVENLRNWITRRMLKYKVVVCYGHNGVYCHDCIECNIRVDIEKYHLFS